MTYTKKKINLNFKTDIPFVIVVVMVLLTALTGLFNQTVLSLGILMCCAILMFYDKLYLGFPFMLFYSIFYGVVFGIAVASLYSAMLIGNAILRMSNESNLRLKCLLPLLVYLIYLILIMLPQSASVFIALLIDVIGGFVLVSDLLKKTDAIKNFFKTYAVVCLCSFFSGILVGNFVGDEYNETRFLATFEDPNYMGFFFTIAIFALVTLKLFDKRIRFIMVISLYLMMLTTLSVTAIVANIALWMFYLIMMKKIKWWSIFVVVLVAMILVSLFNYGLNNQDVPFLSDFANRIDKKLVSLEAGDIDDVTTNRTELAARHFEYYINLPVFNLLFGGIAVNSRYLDPRIASSAHNEYIDMLLNVGVVGAVIMFGYFISNMVSYVKTYRENKEEKYLFLIMAKTVWMCYAMTLTVFIDFRFMLLFLL